MKRVRTILLGLVVVGVGAALGATGTFSAFSAQTDNGGNRMTTGTVVLADDDAGTRMFNIAAARPGALTARCIVVSYTGTLPAEVRLFAATAGLLPPYLTMKVERGTLPAGQGGSCAGFNPDATDYTGAGPGVIADRGLAAFPTAYGAGIVDPSSWGNGMSRGYRFTPTLSSDPLAQGRSATFSVTFEARQS